MTIPNRKPRSENKNYYHFVLYKHNGDRKYYFTAAQIAEDLNISRSSIYRALRLKNHKLFDFGVIVKDYLHVSVVQHLMDREIQSNLPPPQVQYA